jgi:Domain of unknown function (DUF4331)
MTSHREAPGTSKDPVADNTDLYAFVSPDKKETVTIISNFVPLEEPAGGPNFAGFGDNVLYEISIDNNGDALPDITYQFRFKTTFHNPGVFLYNTGQITSLTDPNWNIRQTYSVTKVAKGVSTVLGTDLPSPPVNVGPRSTPLSSYLTLVNSAIKTLGDGSRVFAGQRGEGFYVDLGSIFDLGTLRPVEAFHLIGTPNANGVNTLKAYNVHSIALQIPKTMLTSDGSNPTDPTNPKSTVGIWTSAKRRQAVILDGEGGDDVEAGPWMQVSRLGNPLINEVIIPVGKKDMWNASYPQNDSQFLSYYQDPTLQNLLPVLYPGVFPNLKSLLTKEASNRPRADLVAVLLTGIPPGIIKGFQNVTTSAPADLLRLNMAFDPSVTDNNPSFSSPHRQGLLGGDFDGFPNGRRVFDNTVAVELRAVAGVTYPLVATYTPDAAAGILADTDVPAPTVTTFHDAQNDAVGAPYLNTFPYLPTPYDGYSRKHD